MKHCAIVIFSLLILSGCATAYQPTGMTGGFSEIQLGENAYRVTFQGNGYTLPERASDFTLLRAAQLSLAKGCGYFTADKGVEQITTWPPSNTIQFVCYANKPQVSGIVYDARLIYRTINEKYKSELAGLMPPAPPPAPPPKPAPRTTASGPAADCDQSADRARRIKGCTTLIAANPNADPKILSTVYHNRGAAHAGLNNVRLAFADYDKAIALDPANVDAYYSRAILHNFRSDYRAAEKDFSRTLELFEPIRTAKPSPRNDDFARQLRRRIATARKDGEMEERWVAYLQEIQKRNRYANWSAPPYDLYVRTRTNP